MQYTTLGKTGLVVSRLALGTMTFTKGNRGIASVYKVETSSAERMVNAALDAGINFFDTADGYAGGESEEMLGALLGSRRPDVVVATKVGFRSGEAITHAGLSRQHILRSIDQSLRRLGTDWVDLYIAHREDPFTPLEETLDALDSVVRAGKVRYLGFSNWSAWRAAAAIELQRRNGWAEFTSGQVLYSLVSRDVERDLVPAARHYGFGLTVWSPLAGGFLSGKYTRDAPKDADNRLSGFDLIPFDKERGFRVVDALRPIAARQGATVAQVALRWLLDHRAVSSVLVGSSKISQLEDNLGALRVELTAADHEELDRLTALDPVYPNWFIDGLVDAQVRDAIAASAATR